MHTIQTDFLRIAAMTGKHSRRCLGLLFLLLLCFTMSVAQSEKISDAQQRICNRHDESLRCEQLVRAFQRPTLLTTSPPAIDNPFNFTESFVNKAAGKAMLRQIESDFANRAKEEAQKALQTISTSAATNQNGGAATAQGSTNLVSKPTT